MPAHARRAAFPMPLIAGLVLALGVGSAAQELAVHHSFPEAGSVLQLVVAGSRPGAAVVLDLRAFTEAPPSVQEYLIDRYERTPGGPGVLRGAGFADESGRVTLEIPLDDPDDAGRLIGLEVRDEDGLTSGPIRLLVQPPMLVVPTDDGLARIDLRDGALLQPPIPGNGGLRGAAFSNDGVNGYVLREGGRLEARPAERWGSAPASVLELDIEGDDLAHGPRSGPAFVIVRPAGSPFAPHGRLVFLDETAPELSVDPLGQEVTGRRWAITADGLTAFVAEDNLLVREVDLVSEQSQRQFVAGVPGDRRIVDMVVHEDRLLIATRRTDGGPGALTSLDLTTGHAAPIPLSIDPARLTVLGDGTVLVVPESGSVFQTLEGGILSRVVVPRGEVLDAAPVQTGALLLVATAGGHRIVAWDRRDGLTNLLVDGVPAARRVVAAGHGAAVLLGAPDGSVYRVILDPLGIESVSGARVEPGAPFAVLP